MVPLRTAILSLSRQVFEKTICSTPNFTQPYQSYVLDSKQSFVPTEKFDDLNVSAPRWANHADKLRIEKITQRDGHKCEFGGFITSLSYQFQCLSYI